MSSFFSKAEDKVNQLGDKAEAGIEAAKAAPAAPIPAFSDIAKSSNDVRIPRAACTSRSTLTHLQTAAEQGLLPHRCWSVCL